MTRARALGGRRDLDQSKAQRTARPMVPDRSRSSKHVRIPPLSAAFPRRSTCTKKKLVARGDSPYARNGHPIDSEASAVAQEAAFFATRKLSLHRPRPAAAFSTHSSFGAAMPRRHGPLRRYDGSLQVRSNDPCPTSMQRASCVRDVPHNANASAGAPGLLALPRRSCSRPGVPRRSKLVGSLCHNRTFRAGTEHIVVRPDGRRERERGVA